MNERLSPSRSGRTPNGWRRINIWRIKGPFLVAAFLLGIFGAAFQWGRGIAVALFSLAVPIVGFRAFWSRAKFWITAVLLAAAQVPLVRLMNPLIEEGGVPLMLLFGVCDCMVVVFVTSQVCSE